MAVSSVIGTAWAASAEDEASMAQTRNNRGVMGNGRTRDSNTVHILKRKAAANPSKYFTGALPKLAPLDARCFPHP